jgi:anthranilate synthase/aminodeoxychorismate synthase-like glutamine amidotransferase
MMAAPRVLVVDNRDSFTFNVVQALREAGAATGVVDARAVTADNLRRARLDGLVVSPGPGRPQEAGCSTEAIGALADRIPVWGICLGHQCLAVAHGGAVVSGGQVMHGKTSVVRHDGQGLFSGLPDELEVMRYNSLLVDPASLPDRLAVSAWTSEGEVMGLRCRITGAEGVQFHPESVLSGAARPMFRTWVERCARTVAAGGGVA